ncbi:MAG TPA: hypothetical protein DET40_00585 [Lentisphaeria bacterium]|nr:MAG: hypothetical protein A2X45_09500 [Lentisphaerae bacterium GWF2_50_93]HCE42029.1 hypothetical protein [Lentisphaeria bacterium]
MNFMLALAMSALISVSGWLNEGLKALEKKDYDAAISSLSKITKENSAGTRIYETALFYRAQAYQGKGDKDKALVDLAALLKGECGKELRVEAKRLYVEYGGKPEKLLPEDSPAKVWAKFKELSGNGDFKKALELTTGEWKTLLSRFGGAGGAGAEGAAMESFTREITKGDVGAETMPENPEEEQATLEIRNPEKAFSFKMGFVLDKESNRWLICSFRPEAANFRNAAGAPRAHPQQNENMKNLVKLKQIGLGVRMYSQEHKENFPAGFDELITGGYLENTEMYVWISPEDGSKDKFIYCPGLNESSSVDFLLAAAPRPAKGKREVLYTDGHAAVITEEEFQKSAKAQNWKVPVVSKVEKKDIPEERQKLIRGLVVQIGDSKPEVRQDAKKKLREMGAEAYPILEEFVNHPDPEIKLEIKNILKGK